MPSEKLMLWMAFSAFLGMVAAQLLVRLAQ
jgi:hypothetical protein